MIEAYVILENHHKEIFERLSEDELDSALFVFSNALYNLNDMNDLLTLEASIELFIKAGANAFRLFHFDGQQQTAFECMGYSWDILLNNRISFNDYTPKELAFALLIVVSSKETHRDLVIKNVLKYKKEALKEFYQGKFEELNYLLCKMIEDRIIDADTAEMLFELGAHPLGTNSLDASQTPFKTAFFYKNERMIELMLEKYLQDFDAKNLADIYKEAHLQGWGSIKSLIASGKNLLKEQIAHMLSDSMLNIFVSEVLKDEKPDEKFVMAICRTERIDPDYKRGSILDYAITHHHDSLMKLILSHHSNQLSPKKFYHAIQNIFLNKSYQEHDYKLLIYLDKVKVNENFKREAFNQILIQQIDKTKEITDVIMVIDFIEKNRHLFLFMRKGLLTDDWKNIKSAAVKQIKKIARSSNIIEFQNKDQVESVKVFLRNESGCGLFQNGKKQYEQLIKNKIHISEIVPSSSMH